MVEGAREARLVTLICKRAAVKGGHVLSLPEMQELVRQSGGVPLPAYLPAWPADDGARERRRVGAPVWPYYDAHHA